LTLTEYKVKEFKGDAILKLALCELLLNNVTDKFEKRGMFQQIHKLCNNQTIGVVGKQIGLERFPGNRYKNPQLNKYKPYADAFEVLCFDCYEIDGLELVKIICLKYLINFNYVIS